MVRCAVEAFLSFSTSKARMLSRSFFDRPVVEVAREVIGATLTLEGVGGRIVEVEAYDETDPASHSFKGPTARNGAMFGPAGHAYVYKIYGIHFCLNFVCRPGSAILIRALEPLVGIDAMAARRGQANPRQLCSGPGKLAQALGIDRGHDGLALDEMPFAIAGGGAEAPIVTGPRIGITKGVETPWRFALSGSPFISRPMPKR